MKPINPSIFKAYDIRGIYPTDLNEEAAEVIAQAIYKTFRHDTEKDTMSIVLGRDMRQSSPSLHNVISAALISMGATVVDIGIVPTPTVYFMVQNGKYDGGIQISASHNPGEYNGIKIIRRDGNSLIKIGKSTGMDRIKQAALAGNISPSETKGTVVNISDAVKQEIAAAFTAVNPTITKHTIVIDAANAMGSVFLDELFTHVDADIVRMNWELDGSFPAHQADPLQFNLWGDLRKRVVSEHADFGIMPDGDGDRVFFVDEKGDIIPATLITALISREILTRHPGERILVDIRYIRNVGAVVEKYGGELSISQVGHALITEQLNREHAFFAGESSGHYYFRETGGAESSARVILYVLDALSRANKPLSQLLAGFATSVESGETNFRLNDGITGAHITQSVVSAYKDGELSELDGIAVTYPDWRLSIRSSNTEPLIRLNVEGATETLVKEKNSELTERILNIGASLATTR